MTSTPNTPAKRHPGHFSEETEIQLMLRSISTLEEKVARLESDKDKALVWGIRTLGTLLLGLAAWVYNLVISGKHLP